MARDGAAAEGRQHHQQHDDRRQRHDRLAAPAGDRVEPAAVVAGEEAGRQAEHDSDTTTTMSAPTRLVRAAVEQLRADVAADAVGAERVAGAHRRQGRRRSWRPSGSCEVSSGRQHAASTATSASQHERDDGERVAQQPAHGRRGAAGSASRVEPGAGARVAGRTLSRTLMQTRTFGLSQPSARSTSRLTTTTTSTVTTTMPSTSGHVALAGREVAALADAGEAEHLLDDHGAAEQGDELQGQHGQRRPGRRCAARA